MYRLIPCLFALALIGCDEGIPEDTDTSGTEVDVDTTEPDTDTEAGTDADTELDTDPDTGPVPDGDVNEVNDTREQATVITLEHEQFDLSIHSPDDEDVFAFEIAEQTGVNIRIDFSNGEGDLDMRLIRDEPGLSDDEDPVVATSLSTQDFESLSPSLTPGTYYLEIYGYRGAMTDYDISVDAFEIEEIDASEVYSDLSVLMLENPRVFGSGLNQTFALESDIYNTGTAPAPGSSLGQGTGMFRLRNLDGSIIATGTKGPIFFTNNGGCPGSEIHDEWVLRGEPHLEGTLGNNSLTDPGCLDYYGSSTNNGLDTPLVIGDPNVVPDGDYIYELEVDAANTYVWEASFVRANNSGWVPINIGTRLNGDRTVTVNGPMMQSGVVLVDTGNIATVLGSGDAFAASVEGSSATTSGIGKVWGVTRDPSGKLIASLPDAGQVVRVDGSGNIEVLADGLTEPRGIDVNEDGDLLITDSGTNTLWALAYSVGTGSYSGPAEFTHTGSALSEPSVARYDSLGNVWVANTGGNQVIRIDAVSGTAEVMVGTGAPGLGGDGGGGDAAKLYRPLDLDITDDGMLVIADAYTNRIRVMNTNDAGVLTLGGLSVDAGTIDTLAGVGNVADEAATVTDNGTEGFNGEGRHGRGTVMDLPAAVQVVDDRVFVIDSDNHRVRVFDEFGTAHILAGSTDVPTDARTSGTAATAVGDGAGALAADLNHPSGLFVTATATGYAVDVADAGNHRVRRLDSVILTDGPQIDEN